MHITKQLPYCPFNSAKNKLTREIILNINSTKKEKRLREKGRNDEERDRVEIDEERDDQK